MDADNETQRTPDIIEIELKVKSRSQAVSEAAERLRHLTKERRDLNFDTRNSLRLNKYRLNNKNLLLRYEVVHLKDSLPAE